MFDQLRGNDAIKTVMRRMLTNSRVPRSLLFAGPDGIGKKRFALALAMAAVCVAPNGVEPCGTCPACRRTEVFQLPKPDAKPDEFKRVFFSEHIDVGLVVPCRNNILVDSIRELERESNFRPYEASARFFIIDDAHKMNDAASNALLKTLEEPSLTSHIFLLTSRPDALLQTIRSRCQTLRFAPLSIAEIEAELRRTETISPIDAPLVARLANGSIGRALEFDIERYRERRQRMLSVLTNLAGDANLAALLQSGEELNDARLKDDFEAHFESLQTLIHDLWLVACDAPDERLVNIDLADEIRKLAARFERSRLADWQAEIETLLDSLRVNVNRKIAADALFMRMAAK